MFSSVLGSKSYELKDHLGNVRAVITDQKILEDVDGNDEINLGDYYTANVVSFSDYFPFGMLQRSGQSIDNNYRYAFNGMEQDNEVAGKGNSYTTTFRNYNARIGKWLSLDPKGTAWESYYTSMSNNPILYADPLGDKVRGSLGGLFQYYKYKAKLKIQKARVTKQLIEATRSGDAERMAALGEVQSNLSQQQQSLDKMKESKVVFYIHKHAGEPQHNQSQSIVSVNQYSRRSRKGNGKVHIMLYEGQEQKGLAYGSSIASQFLEGDYSFQTTIGKWSKDYGILTDQSDLEDALKSGLYTELDLSLSTTELSNQVSDFSDKARDLSKMTSYPDWDVNLGATVPGSLTDDDGRASISTVGYQKYGDVLYSPAGNYKDKEVFFDSDRDGFTFPNVDNNDYLNKGYERKGIKNGQLEN